MTKPIVCTALMTLFEEARFKLIDPVALYIPAFGKVKVLEQDASGNQREVDPVRPILVRDLMTHTSGLSYSFLEESPVCEMYRQSGLMNESSHSLETMIEKLARYPLAYHPGSRWHYGLGIDVAAHLIEVLSGQSLGQFLKQRLFEPLGMNDTSFMVPPEKLDHLSAMYGLPDIALPTTKFSEQITLGLRGYNERSDVSGTYPTDDPHFERGGHGLYATAGDYLRFAQMLLRGELDGTRILGRKTLELMHSNHLPASLLPYGVVPDFPSMGYGFGLGSRVLMNVAESGMPGSVGEFGWGGAAKTYYWVDPQEELVGVLMSQSMMSIHLPDMDLRTLAYQAIVD